jgi:hypothetical protein
VRLACLTLVAVSALELGGIQRERVRVKLLPVDEAAQVPAFKAFRDALRAAVAARDADRVLALMHPAIGQGGLEMALRTTKEQLGGQEHQSWTALDELLRLGGTFTKGPNRVRDSGERQYAAREFCAPYVWSAFPAPLPDPVAGLVDP